MRLFVGIAVPRDVVDAVARFVGGLRGRAKLRWSALEDIHVTTKFIGEWPDARVAEIEAALAAIAFAPFTLEVRGLGWFPTADSPRVFWAGIDAPSLAALAAETERALAPLGIEAETRPYAPHLTLARIPRGTSLDDLRVAFDRLPYVEFGTFRADAFALYESRGGHHVRARFPLVARSRG